MTILWHFPHPSLIVAAVERCTVMDGNIGHLLFIHLVFYVNRSYVKKERKPLLALTYNY